MQGRADADAEQTRRTADMAQFARLRVNCGNLPLPLLSLSLGQLSAALQKFFGGSFKAALIDRHGGFRGNTATAAANKSQPND